MGVNWCCVRSARDMQIDVADTTDAIECLNEFFGFTTCWELKDIGYTHLEQMY